MRDCFTDFINIRGQQTSKSGLYINDLPGLPMDLINKMRTEDDTTLTQFYDRFYERSVYTFVDVVGQRVAGKFYNNEQIESRVSGEFKTDNNTSSEEYAGVSLDLPESRFVENQILTVQINSVSAGSPVPAIYIFDKVGGTLLDTFQPETISAGINTYNYYNTFDQDELYIAYKPAEMILKKTKTDDRYYDRQSALTSVHQINEGGIIVSFSNYCSLEKFVCSRLYALRYAFRNHLGVELMKERILTNTINRYTTLTEEKANQLGEMYMKELDQSLDTVLKHGKIEDDKLCVECRGTVGKRRLIP